MPLKKVEHFKIANNGSTCNKNPFVNNNGDDENDDDDITFPY